MAPTSSNRKAMETSLTLKACLFCDIMGNDMFRKGCEGMKVLKRWQIRFLKHLCQRYEVEMKHQSDELTYSAYLMTAEQRRDVQLAKEDAEFKVRALNRVINDLYVELDGEDGGY